MKEAAGGNASRADVAVESRAPFVEQGGFRLGDLCGNRAGCPALGISGDLPLEAHWTALRLRRKRQAIAQA